MYKILFGLAFAAVIAKPALAQDYRKNFNECAKELAHVSPSAIIEQRKVPDFP
jgi:hypothetical protein